MTEINLVRQPGEIPKADAEAARRVLFGAVDGLGDQGRKQWRRFWNGVLRLEPGEIVSIITHRPRIGVHHRKHMLIEQRVFEAQDRFEQFDAFRYWLKVGAGFVVWAAGPKGGVVPIPKSISYSATGEDEFQEFHDNAMAFLRGPHAANYLWPHLKGPKADAMMDELLTELRE
jgi:hypothetical protein